MARPFAFERMLAAGAMFLWPCPFLSCLDRLNDHLRTPRAIRMWCLYSSKTVGGMRPKANSVSPA